MNFNPLTPEFDVSNIDKSKEFYVDLLGFKVEYERPEDKFAYLSFEDNVQIMVSESNMGRPTTGSLDYPFGRGINFQIHTHNLSKIYASITEKGLRLFKDMQISNYRMNDKTIIQKEFLVQDPDGYLLRFAENIV